MCGRFTLTNQQYVDLAKTLGVLQVPGLAGEYRARYNIAPSNRHWLWRAASPSPTLELAEWGLIPHWAKEPKGFINARVETLDEKPTFRNALKRGRCGIPADGFYEWSGPKENRVPRWFHFKDRSIFLFAGLFDDWVDPSTGSPRRTFTIVTRDASGDVKPFHDRMPVILNRAQAEEWQAEETSKPVTFLVSLTPPHLEVTQVSKRVNSPGNDGPELLEEAADLGK